MYKIMNNKITSKTLV